METTRDTVAYGTGWPMIGRPMTDVVLCSACARRIGTALRLTTPTPRQRCGDPAETDPRFRGCGTLLTAQQEAS